MPLGQKQASMILIMPYHLEPLDRLEKLLTRKQVDTWLSKMENKAVAISLPKISLDVSHNLQVSGGSSTRHESQTQVHQQSFDRRDLSSVLETPG